ncbi:MAG TPA: hypothetical protein VNO50_12790 [Pyrinomonadaceae bacterium]|nr:hypothetical protein [Pyrinomonadaceae bacterium]
MVFERKIAWENEPPINDAISPYDLFRIPGRGTYNFIILSRQLHGCKLHYFKGRSIPHTEGGCEACENKNETRWRGYLAVCNASNFKQGILELTAVPAAQIAEKIKLNEPIRGKIATLHRPSGKPNGRIQLDLRPGKIPDKELPEPFNVIATLKKIWNVQDHMRTPHVLDIGVRSTTIEKLTGGNNGSRKS